MNFSTSITKRIKINKNNLEIHQITHKPNIDIIINLIDEATFCTISQFQKSIILNYMNKLKNNADLIEAVFQLVEENITDNDTFLEVKIHE